MPKNEIISKHTHIPIDRQTHTHNLSFKCIIIEPNDIGD